jgi:Fe(II)/alpha-ketoglutarate-dependent arginine beta-hydroxylase
MSRLVLSEREISRLVLSERDISEIQSLLNNIAKQYNSVEDDSFLKNSSLFAQELPRRIREFFNDFKFLESNLGICIISGYPIDDSKIGKTPKHWKWKDDASRTLKEQILLVLYGSLLGYVFGWSTQQDGYIVHDVCPIKSNENDQIGCGSLQRIWWHTEDAFHSYRPDYVGLTCLRNPAQVATTIANLDIGQLDEAQVKVLFEPRFIIRPDESHYEKNQSDLRKEARARATCDSVKFAYDRTSKMSTNLMEKVPVLFGASQSPYLRLDPYFMEKIEDDEEAANALNALIRAINMNLKAITLQPGDYCFIDNYRAVHGREAFKPNYDGSDRWLKRINVAIDLRKSRDARATSTSRIIL